MPPYQPARRATGGQFVPMLLIGLFGSVAVTAGIVALAVNYGGMLRPAKAQAVAAAPGAAGPAAPALPSVTVPGRAAPAPAASASAVPAALPPRAAVLPAAAPAPMPASAAMPGAAPASMPMPMPMPTVQTPATAVSRSAPIGWAVPTSARRAPNGHYYFDTLLNGTAIRMMFDTGASVVALRAEDAARAGIATNALDYNITVSTGNGTTTAAAVRLDTLQVGGVTVRNVAAMVSRPGQLGVSLLGQSFMARLAGYRIERDELILQGN